MIELDCASARRVCTHAVAHIDADAANRETAHWVRPAWKALMDQDRLGELLHIGGVGDQHRRRTTAKGHVIRLGPEACVRR